MILVGFSMTMNKAMGTSPHHTMVTLTMVTSTMVTSALDHGDLNHGDFDHGDLNHGDLDQGNPDYGDHDDVDDDNDEMITMMRATVMMKAFLLLLGYLSDTSPLGHRTVSNLDMNY